jgi:hypothetical protein
VPAQASRLVRNLARAIPAPPRSVIREQNTFSVGIYNRIISWGPGTATGDRIARRGGGRAEVEECLGGGDAGGQVELRGARRAAPGARPPCRFRNRGAGSVSAPGAERMRGGTKPRCGRALCRDCGARIARFAGIQGEITYAATRMPRRRKSKGLVQPGRGRHCHFCAAAG